MYILISIGTNDVKSNEFCSRKKKDLLAYLKKKGYYWSTVHHRYIDDKNNGGYSSGIDYGIEYIPELMENEDGTT